MVDPGDSPADATAPSGALPEDDLFRLLSSGRRRAAVRYLESEHGEAPLDEVTRWVALEEGIGEDAEPEEFKKVYVSLYQTHVPAMEEVGVVEYDADDRIVRLTPRAAPLLEHLGIDDRSTTSRLFSKLFGHEESMS